MKILKRPIMREEPETIKMVVPEPPKFLNVICEYCHAELEVSQDDGTIGWNGWWSCECPVCGQTVYVEEWDCRLDENTIEFPIHFYSKDKDKAIHVEDATIQNYIRKGIKWMKDHPDEQFYFIETGDSFVVLLALDGDEEYDCYVARDVFSCEVPMDK